MMSEMKPWPKAKFVRGPDGWPLMISDLPPSNTSHWVIRQKAKVVAAVRGGLISIEEACQRYSLTEEEFAGWERACERFCIPDLRAIIRRHPIAKIDAGTNDLLRRSMTPSRSTIRAGKLTINLRTRTVDVSDRPVVLENMEYEVLEFLALRSGTIVTKDMFLDHLYHGIAKPHRKIIDIFICKLRRKLAAAAEGVTYIETIWGRGYRLRQPDGAHSVEHKTDQVLRTG